jgi:Flp pilus assembly protein TadD
LPATDDTTATAPPPRAEADPGRQRDALLALAVIAIATSLAYSNTLHSSFHLDDLTTIVRNEGIRDLGAHWPPWENRALGHLSFALNQRLGGLDPFGYHLANLLIHLCNALLVFRLTAITLRAPALREAEAGPLLRRFLPLAAGLLFALHPIQTQAVTYVVQRFASLATLFYLLSVVLYAESRLSLDQRRARAASLYLLSLLAAAAAMRSKEISFTLPVVIAGYELLFFRGSARRLLLVAPIGATALLIPLGLAASGQTLADVLGDSSALAETQDIPRSVYLLTQSRVVATYLRLLVLPVGQNLDWDFPLSHGVFDPAVLLSVAVLLAVGGGAVLLLVRARRSHRPAGVLFFFGVAWFFVASSVESSVIPIRDVLFEHRVYLPFVGAAIALGTAVLCGVERLRPRLPAGIQCAAALLATAGPLGAATYARNLVWKDEVTLWSDVASKSPRKPRPHNNLGVSLWEQGRVEEALREYREAIRLDPGYAEPHDNLGIALYWARHEVDEAIQEYREAIRLAPQNARAHNNLGVAYRTKGLVDPALLEFREAIRLDPALPQAHANLGAAYVAQGRIMDAVRECQEAIRLDPGRADSHLFLGLSFQAMGLRERAAQQYRDAVRLDPGLAEARDRLRAILAERAP